MSGVLLKLQDRMSFLSHEACFLGIKVGYSDVILVLLGEVRSDSLEGSQQTIEVPEGKSQILRVPSHMFSSEKDRLL